MTLLTVSQRPHSGMSVIQDGTKCTGFTLYRLSHGLTPRRLAVKSCPVKLTVLQLFFDIDSMGQCLNVQGICLTTDLDFVFHMNNSRYLRECDFARFDFWIRTSLWKKIRNMGGSMTNGGNNIRYRKSIELFDRYNIHTKISYWDEKSFYFEQTFVRCSDKFICAIVIVKQTLIGITPDQLIAEIDSSLVKPEPLPDILKWIESNQLSSERLRKSL